MSLNFSPSKLNQIFNSIFQPKERDYFKEHVFRIRLTSLTIFAVFQICTTLLNPFNTPEATIISVFFNTSSVLALFLTENNYLLAVLAHFAFHFPAFMGSSNPINSLRIPVGLLLFNLIYQLQFFPFVNNILFLGSSFYIVRKANLLALETIGTTPETSFLFTSTLKAWLSISLIVFAGVNAYQFKNKGIWKDYIKRGEELELKNIELHKANTEMRKLLEQLEMSNTMLENTNKSLAEALKSQDLFVACVSHELRNPLNAMIGNIELLQQELQEPHHKKMLKTCQICGDMLLMLINNILDVAKIKADKLEISPVNTKTYGLLEKIWEMSKPGILQKGLTGKLIISRGFPAMLKVDSHRFTQVILNLVNNALKFTAKGGIEILISWEGRKANQWINNTNENDLRENYSPLDKHKHQITNEGSARMISESSYKFISGLNENYHIFRFNSEQEISRLEETLATDITNIHGNLTVEVRDTGCGIPEDIQKKLFQPFTQADPSVTREYGGTGLGLFIIKQLIQKLGGEITLTSIPGKGSKFRFNVPVEASSSPKIQFAKSRQLTLGKFPSENIKKGRVLIVDDSNYNQLILKAFMNNLGMDVDTADNGQAAVDKIIGKPFGYYSLVTMDIQMPVMDGITATKLIRSYEIKNYKNRNRLPIIIVTGNCSADEQAECLNPYGEVRANYFFSKPFLFTDCKTCVEAILGIDDSVVN